MASSYRSQLLKRNSETADGPDRATLEQYQAFMTGYVKRINEATFNVDIAGIRIGSAKYSRLAQINLKTRIITFSRHAIENVPERGRRYLVLHELAHVKEASHNRRFWELVGCYEPNYRQIGKSLELAFKDNVKKEDALRIPRAGKSLLLEKPERNLLVSLGKLLGIEPSKNKDLVKEPEVIEDNKSLLCLEDEILSWLDEEQEREKRTIDGSIQDEMVDWTC